jgi:diguanylate cyclase (GGDEF)-like protein
MSKKTGINLDKLTGVFNYQAFQDDFAEGVKKVDEGLGCISIAFIDIDFFKKLNDEHGHLAGDMALITVANHLKESLSGVGDVYRYGGDEFAVLMPNHAKEQAFLAMERARTAFGGEQEIQVEGKMLKLPVSLSVGVATYPDDGKSQEVIRKASDAVFRAKADGRNKVCLAREERMVTKTSHYTQGQLDRLAQLAKREGVGEAILLRESLDDLLRKYTF